MDPETARIVTVCVVGCGGGQATESLTWLADLGIDIPPAAAAVHGITTDRARAEGRPAADVIAEIIDALTGAARDGIPVVVMHAVYDLPLLDREARRHGIRPLSDADTLLVAALDPRVLDKQTDPFRRGRRTLTDLARHYHIAHDEVHTACRVTWRMAHTVPDLSTAPLDQLHQLQTQWARRQADDPATYFRSTPGKEHQAESVHGDWPFIPNQRQTTN